MDLPLCWRRTCCPGWCGRIPECIDRCNRADDRELDSKTYSHLIHNSTYSRYSGTLSSRDQRHHYPAGWLACAWLSRRQFLVGACVQRYPHSYQLVFLRYHKRKERLTFWSISFFERSHPLPGPAPSYRRLLLNRDTLPAQTPDAWWRDIIYRWVCFPLLVNRKCTARQLSEWRVPLGRASTRPRSFQESR